MNKIKYIFKAARYKIWFLTNRKRFKHLGRYSTINSPLRIDGHKNISIGSKVTIAYKTWLAANPLTQLSECELIIEDGCVIGNFNHLYATNKIHIEMNVLTADKVYISDNSHSFEDISVLILKQPFIQKKAVRIGSGTWLGENVCIIGATIGKNCVIGANSVVTIDIPDFSVAVGSPARVIKRFCFERQKWVKTDINGKFIEKE